MDTHEKLITWRAAAAALVVLCIGLLLGGCATNELVLYNVGSADPKQPGSYVQASPEQARQGLRISRDGQALPIRVPMPVAVGDVIETLPLTLVVIRFPEGHEVTMLPGTQVRLGSADIRFGEVYVRSFLQWVQSTQGRFKVKTDYVTAGVEGTEFWVRVGRDASMSVGVVDGRVSLTSVGGRWQPVDLLPSEVATVARDAPPTKSARQRAELDAIVQLMRSGLRFMPPPAPPPRALPVPRQ